MLWCALVPAGLAAQNKSYCVSLDDSKVPALVNRKLLTLNVNVGTCTSVSVTANGVPISASYSASTQVASFNTTGTASLVVTAINWTAGGTGATTKATLYNNYHWAYSQTFDDVRQTQYDYAKPILDGLGLKAGLAAVASWIESGNNYYQTWTEVLAFMADGWDVYNHTWDHPNPVTCGTFINEFGQNQTAFLTQVTGYNVSHSVFPYEVSVATCAGYPQNFIISGELDTGANYTYVDVPLTTANTLTVARNGLYGTDPTTIENISSKAANDARPSWEICITHSVTQGGGAAADAYSTNQTALTTLYNYLLTNWGPAGKGTMWFAPSGQVQDYLFTRDNAVVTTCAVPTDTPTPVASRTGSPSATGTASRTVISSPSATGTASRTTNPSPSATGTASRTASPSPSPSGTAVASLTASPSETVPSRTASPSPSVTALASLTASPSETAAANGTTSLSPSATGTGIATQSVTAGSSPSPSYSVSFTPSLSQSPTATFGISVTFSSTATDMATAVSTPSPTYTLSPKDSATPSPTLSVTQSPTASSTKLPSVMSSATYSVMVLPSGTATASSTLGTKVSATSTITRVAPSPTESVTRTASSMPSPSGGPLVIRFGQAVPNPNPDLLDLEMEGPANGVLLTVFTQAFVLVRQNSVPVALSSGWNKVPLGTLLKSLPLGLYYFEAQALRGSVRSAPMVVKVYLTRP